MARPKFTECRTICTFAGEFQRLVESGSLTEEQETWCRIVLANNTPGQRIHADADALLACEESAGLEVHRANVR